MNAELDCAESVSETEFDIYIRNIKQQQLKLMVDNWLEKYDAWLTKWAIKAQKACKQNGTWEDFKSEMILQCYEAALNRFDDSRGVPLGTFLIGTLWNYCSRGDVINRCSIKRNKTEGLNDNWPLWNEKQECDTSYFALSSLERSHGVFSMLNTLHEGERMLMKLHYEIGLSHKTIDDLMMVSHSTTFHRIQSIILRLQGQVKDVG